MSIWNFCISKNAIWIIQSPCNFLALHDGNIFKHGGENLEVFVDGFSVFGDTFEDYLQNLELVLCRCQETNLVLNWEKCHFMVIEKLPLPTSVKGIRSFLGHVGFYRRFIKDFPKISKPLCTLLEQNRSFNFDWPCLQAFEELKKRLITTPIVTTPSWTLLFRLVCDASEFAIGAILGQRKVKLNCITTKKELSAIVFSFDKFRAYLMGTKVTVYTKHSTIKYLVTKKDDKRILIRWIFLL
ncbi:Retrovirus-related Pol polyprotein from transposon 17.6 [Gossypium australe]|uniref:Retrovirus-related Pol polyprotein from transposon 17.6 n=1 Tax=Gossypium australe TaxID=47621 RepID=A0A5B6VWW6_9ROSI|nr:Retrovirus-related Pol polyprotein from transposon 17.6 [Gossypium australe]